MVIQILDQIKRSKNAKPFAITDLNCEEADNHPVEKNNTDNQAETAQVHHCSQETDLSSTNFGCEDDTLLHQKKTDESIKTEHNQGKRDSLLIQKVHVKK